MHGGNEGQGEFWFRMIKFRVSLFRVSDGGFGTVLVNKSVERTCSPLRDVLLLAVMCSSLQ